MAARIPEEAHDDWIGSVRRAIQCVAQAEVFGSGRATGRLLSIRVVHGSGTGHNTVPLRLRTGEQALRLRLFLGYSVITLPDMERNARFAVRTGSYNFELIDRHEKELVAYHWHPEGMSHILAPHMHIQAAPFQLPVGSGSEPTLDLSTDKAHFPTGLITLQQVIRLLIEDLGVEPRVPDWREVLEVNQEFSTFL